MHTGSTLAGRLLDPIFGTDRLMEATDDAALLKAMCRAEAALALACSRFGFITPNDAAAVVAACHDLPHTAPDDLEWPVAADGNPVRALVAQLRATVQERAGARAAAAVHYGATSQDIVDTALMLMAQDSLAVILAEVSGCAERCAELAREHQNTAMAGRTLLQLAEPTVFGVVAAGWGRALDHVNAKLTRQRAELPAQLGGAVGTLAGWYPKGFAVLATYASELGLAEPRGPWHTDRTVVVELASALGAAAATIAKVALDIVVLAQNEVGELAEANPGVSSAMPHKRNPVAAVSARAGAAQAPGLVATIVSATPELQRGAGPWHAEWPALLGLLRVVGGSAARLRQSLAGLVVDVAAMRRNLSRLETATDISARGHGPDLVSRYLDDRADALTHAGGVRL